MRFESPFAKPLLLAVLAASFLAGTFPGRACQYCRLAATDPEAAKMAAKLHGGGFPLDATLDQFQPTMPPAILSARPTSGSVAITASDLAMAPRATVAVPANPVMEKQPASGLPVQQPTAVSPGVMQPASPIRWADTGLLGLLGLGGWFCWRTRRVSAPVG